MDTWKLQFRSLMQFVHKKHHVAVYLNSLIYYKFKKVYNLPLLRWFFELITMKWRTLVKFCRTPLEVSRF